MGMLN